MELKPRFVSNEVWVALDVSASSHFSNIFGQPPRLGTHTTRRTCLLEQPVIEYESLSTSL